MKRKVIQIANSTQLVSLPRKWSQKYGVKKGDEIEVEEQGNKIILSINKGADMGVTKIDVTGLNRTTIIYYIQTLYRYGFDTINVHFNKPAAVHYRLGKEISISSIIHGEVNRLIGFEIVEQKENFYAIKDLAQSSIGELDHVIRRIFLLINDASSDLIKGATELNHTLIGTIEEKHDTVTKFISYCLRLLNKYGYPDYKKTCILYHILSTLDRLTDVLKYSARELLKIKKPLNSKTLQMMTEIDNSIKMYSEFFFKFERKKADDIYRKRNEVLVLLDTNKTKIPPAELVILGKMEQILELLVDVEVARLGIEH
ncbi:AbrB/MazE/SpoVT family DNA-binding domain-containing protein [Candidatus Woesearchaeota archaeon]|nr:AbrB/MazE/SpoVT family DNA-binding domain-containing protein [Candidatus Woesearchaeota archaeon]MBI2130349.1 AbrB/MazE/SpoVT family DNA-binding domain-containing protein [Candidatus Woesearchaeota archaeon]MBI2661818.1 AbrB/MazE/SpoVT family DNA-binding domain-containing protein [Candidatus Woesearchaeota archaeon]